MIDADVEISTGIAIETNFQYASYLIFGMQILMILLLGSCAKDNFIGGTDFTNYYNSFTGVEIMMFIGFGYLMTFLRRYGMGAVGLTMLVTVLAMQWGMWTEVSGSCSYFSGCSHQNSNCVDVLSVMNSGSSPCGMRASGPRFPSTS